MIQENHNETEDNFDLPEVEEGQEDSTDWKAEAEKLKEKAIRQRESTKTLKLQIKELEQYKPKPQDKIENKKSDEKLFERLDKLALKTAGINEADEVELYNKWKDQTGREADEITENKIFQAELTDLRIARANQLATSNIKGEQGESGVKNTPDYWLAKATKGDDGKIRLPEETPKELYPKILNKLAEKEQGSSETLKFYSS